MSKVSVIVVAAGRGERFGDQENKIFAKLDGQPLFLRALQLFVNRDDVIQTLLVVSPQDVGTLKSKYGANLGFMGVKLVEGGAQRCTSVANGLSQVTDDADFVAIHDAVRACVAEQWIDRIFEAAAEAKSGAAIPVVPITGTIKRLSPDRNVTETVPRDDLYIAQTPQVFRRTLLQKAYAKIVPDGSESQTCGLTDDAQVVSAAGITVAAVDGDPRNIKITTKADLSLAGVILKALPKKPSTPRGVFEEAQW